MRCAHSERLPRARADIFELRAWSVRPPPLPPAPPPGLPSPPPPVACTPAVLASNSVLWRAGAADAVLTGAAALGAPDGGAHGTARLDLTPAVGSRMGAAEFRRVIHPATDCVCPGGRYMLLTIYVWLGGGVMPGEGLVVSMVDATRQTPGATTYMAGCGVRGALPVHSISIVFDSASSDVACDEPDTGTRLVSTMGGADAAPQVLSATLDMRVDGFRSAAWVPLQFVVGNSFSSAFPDGFFPSGWGGQAAASVWAPYLAHLNGTELLCTGTGDVARDDRNTTALSAFYVVASARTSERASDAHAVSGLRLECGAEHPRDGNNEVAPAIIMELFENWAGLTQPLTPPPHAAPPRPPPALHIGAPQCGASAAASGGAAFAISLFASLALLAGVAVTWHHLADRRRVASHQEEGIAGPNAADGVDVLLSYRHEDWRLVDAVHDKLTLHYGLRTRKHVEPGRPFDERSSALRCAAVFAPIITLPGLQALAADAADAVLAEWLLALYFKHEQPRGAGVRLIHPLLVGSEVTDAGRCRWLSLLDDPSCAAALAALPDAVPVGTVALANASLRATGAAPLPRRFASLTVRQIVLGCGELRGILSGAPFALACAEEDLGLYITRGYAAPILALLNV